MIAAETKAMSQALYLSTYKHSVEDNEDFWAKQARKLKWDREFSRIKDVSFDAEDLHIKWFDDGELNVCVNCVDRHLPTKANQTALIWESDQPGQSQYITYQALYHQVCQLANALEAKGVRAGDRVILYMPMVPEAVYGMLACARIGAIHSCVFGGFSAQALADRIVDCAAKIVLTADFGMRGGKAIALKDCVDEALQLRHLTCVTDVIVVKQNATTKQVHWNADRDSWYHELVADFPTVHKAQALPAEQPLFILYTSGSTGTPKGLQHSSAGYLTYALSTFKHVFDYRDGDVYWCTADVGWITGHSYLVYGPLAAGAVTLMYEGVPNYPDLGRFGEIIDKHKVNIFYTAPTVIRTLMTNPDMALGSSARASLRILGSVGEPINPGVWQWYHDQFGLGRAAVVDTWWQTETGGHLITPLPSTLNPKPGAAMQPFFGIQPQLVDHNSDIIEGSGAGHLVVLDSWPGQARTIWGDHERFIQTYFTTHIGMYFSGDGAKRDKDGHYWITGRVDDVLNVSGHRLGTAEIESATVSHPNVAEAAVVGFPHDIKGEAIYIYITPMAGVEPDDTLSNDVRSHIRRVLGPIASPDKIQWARGLPKTRSGKIMRRILRQIARNDFENLGDISTLADPSVIVELVEQRVNR